MLDDDLVINPHTFSHIRHQGVKLIALSKVIKVARFLSTNKIMVRELRPEETSLSPAKS